MLTLHEGYAQLTIERDAPFQEVTESVRSLLQICRLNRLSAAVVVSRQDDFDWRSSLRVAIRFYRTRYTIEHLRLALVKPDATAPLAAEVVAFVRDSGMECDLFRAESEALAWVSAGRARP